MEIDKDELIKFLLEDQEFKKIYDKFKKNKDKNKSFNMKIERPITMDKSPSYD